MRLTRPLSLLTLAFSSIPCSGCGGGGGGSPPLFPADVTPQDLVAVTFDDASTHLPRLSLADVRGRGEAIIDDLAIADGGVIDDFEWSPDHAKLAVLAQPNGDVGDILYVVEPLTGTVSQASGPQAVGTNVDGFAWSPDSSRLAFVRQSSDAGNRIFVVRADGSGLVDATGALVVDGGVGNFEWSPDAIRVAFEADADVSGVHELFVVNRDGTGRVKVSGTLVTGGDVDDFHWSPDSTRLAFNGFVGTTAAFELFTAPADGTGGRVRVHPAFPTGGNLFRFFWAPDASRIAYVADQVTNDVAELFSSLPDGTGNVKLSGTLASGGDVKDFFCWAPDSSRIAFVADRQTDDVHELFTVPGDGSSAGVKVSGTMIANGDIGGFSFTGDELVWSPDSTRIAYVADQDLDDSEHLYVTLAASASSIRLTPSPSPFDQTFQVEWTPNSVRIVCKTQSSLHVSTVAGPSVAIVTSEAGFIGPKRPILSFAGDRLVGTLDVDATSTQDVRSYDVVTGSETIVATPDAEAFSVEVE